MIYDVKAPRDAIDPEWIKEWVGEFDLTRPISEQVEAIVKGYLRSISLQWSPNGLNVYPIGSEDFGEFHGWAFRCWWSVLREELYVFASSHAHQDGSAYTDEGLREINKLRDELAKMVKILDREISAGKPSQQTMKRFR